MTGTAIIMADAHRAAASTLAFADPAKSCIVRPMLRSLVWLLLAAPAASLVVPPGPARAELVGPVVIEVASAPAVVEDRQDGSADGRAYRIDDGGYLDLAGNECKVLIEKGGEVVVRGTRNTLYLRSGSKGLVVGDSNTIFVTAGAKVTVRGKDNQMRFASAFEIRQGSPPPAGNGRQPVATAPATIRPGGAIAGPAAAPAAAAAGHPPAGPPPPAPPSAPASAPAVAVVPAKPITGGGGAGGANGAAGGGGLPPPPATAPTPAARPTRPDPAVASTPWIAAVLALLPTAADAVAAADPAVAAAPGAMPGDLVGDWEIVGLLPAGRDLGAFGPAASGNIRFDGAGRGAMNVLIDILGDEIVRGGPFTWRADGENLFINGGTAKASVWRRGGQGSASQSATLTGTGLTPVTLKIRRAGGGR